MTETRDYLDKRWRLEIERRRLLEGLSPGESIFGFGLWRYEIVCSQPAISVLGRVRELAKILNEVSLTGAWPSVTEWERFLPRWFVSRHWPSSGEAYLRYMRDLESLPRDDFLEKYAASDPLLESWLNEMTTSTDEQGRIESSRMWFWFDATVTGDNTIEAYADAVDAHILWDFPWMFQAAGARTIHGGEVGGESGPVEF